MSQQELRYCFEITLKNKEKRFLCSVNRFITLNNVIYHPASGLWLEKYSFNDSAQNEMIIHGVFEAAGISKTDILGGAKVKVIFVRADAAERDITYYCTEFNKNDLDFYLKCEPESFKYEQSLLKLFSKTCRADFGDNKCSIDGSKYGKQYQIQSIEQNIITCLDLETEDFFYKDGIAQYQYGEEKYECKIKAHYSNRIELDSLAEELHKSAKEVVLIPTCDKSFRTCCNKFNNAVNFRGEPSIPEYNILKN